MNKKTKLFLRKKVDKFSRIKQYFLRGHIAWFALVMQLINFTLIFYNFLYVKLEGIPEGLMGFEIFFLLFLVVYTPVATVIGYYDYKKGTFKEEQEIQLEMSPIYKKMFEKLDRIEKKLEKEKM